jgi:1-acyl-sn-glycerol-3-phosphate acyltransferase
MNQFHQTVPYILQKIGYAISFVVLKFFVHLKISGNEYLENVKGPLILVSNHTNEIDPAIFALILKYFSKHFPIYFVSNPKEKYKTFGWRSYFYGGTFFNMLGAYPIFSGHKDYAYSLQNHLEILDRGYSVCIYPEGKRTLDGNFSLAHGGVAYLAYKSHAPVIPIAINTFFGLTLRDFFLRRRKVTVKVGNPMYLKDIFDISDPNKIPEVSDFKSGAQKILDVIQELYRR